MGPKSKTSPLSRSLLVSLGIPAIFFPGLILAAILGWSWQKDLSKLVKLGGYKQSKQIFPTQATVTKVIDGDTFQIDNGQTVRLLGIDAPNKGEKDYQKAKEYLKDLIENEEIKLEYDYYQDDKFGRILAYAFEKCKTTLGCRHGERMINWVMLKKGLAKILTYEDRRKLKYEDLLNQATSP